MKYQKRGGIVGKWANKEELKQKGVKRAKITSETNSVPSTTYTNDDGTPKMQDVCKVLFEGEKESANVALNGATINALIDAFGNDSKDWQGHYLSVEIDKQPGKKFPLYLIPEGYERTEDAAGWPIIVKEGSVSTAPSDGTNLDEEPGMEVPF